MRYINYSISWFATVFSLSFYYKMFGDIFYAVYSQPSMNSIINGGSSARMPEFNWKINVYIWLFCVFITGIAIGLIMDGVCKDHNKDRKRISLPAIIITQGICAVVYVLFGMISGHNELFFTLERFLGEILFDILPSFYPPREYFGLAIVHALIFSIVSLYFYLTERKRQNIIIEKEIAHRKERENQA
ncbi:MAG: hypothetical protein IKZ25_04450 [Clostridia bacterium]|nr:hypothetical protein [Clostridia bacterium]